MKNTPSQTPMNQDDRTRHAGAPAHTLGSVLVIAVAMSLYAYIRLANTSTVFTVAVLILVILEIVRIVMALRSSTSRPDISFEIAFFVVLLSVLLGAYSTSLAKHPAFLLATIFYRPSSLLHGNRRLAFALSLLIMLAVLPVTFGAVTDPDIVQLLTGIYVMLVLGLWVFCSKFGTDAIEQILQ